MVQLKPQRFWKVTCANVMLIHTLVLQCIVVYPCPILICLLREIEVGLSAICSEAFLKVTLKRKLGQIFSSVL